MYAVCVRVAYVQWNYNLISNIVVASTRAFKIVSANNRAAAAAAENKMADLRHFQIW